MLTLADLIEGLAGRRPSAAAQPLRRFVIDSREVGPHDVFVAFRGEKTDGHLYVAEAFGRGAVAAIVEQEVPLDALLIDLRAQVTRRSIAQWTLPVIFRVDNSMLALQELARWWRSRLTNLRVIGITGSVHCEMERRVTCARRSINSASSGTSCSTMAATAPRLNASATYKCPSVFSPRNATKTSDGPTSRESITNRRSG